MDWVYVARWLKKGDSEKARAAADEVRRHWVEVALDQGFDPEKNVTLMESEAEIRVAISELMDMEFREEAGSWQYY